jgi:hypothetical protein
LCRLHIPHRSSVGDRAPGSLNGVLTGV